MLQRALRLGESSYIGSALDLQLATPMVLKRLVWRHFDQGETAMHRRLLCTGGVLLAAAIAHLCAQSGNSQDGYYGYAGADPYYGYPGVYGSHHASTAGEGYARGMADVIRSYGENNLANARAQREWEAARKEYINNRTLATKAFWERRQLYQQYRAAEQYEDREKAAAYLATIRLQDLSPQEFDSETGQIIWPKLLADPRFKKGRTMLDELFARRAEYGELSVDEYSKAESLIKLWRDELTEDRDAFPEEVLRDSLRFLLRLNRELEHNYS
jgi:hypothetical protein